MASASVSSSPPSLGGVGGGVEYDRNLKRAFSKPFAGRNLEGLKRLLCNAIELAQDEKFGDRRIETRESHDISACLSTT